MTGASVGAVAGTMSGFWNSAGIRFNREQVARQVLPTIYRNLGYLAGVGASYRAGEALMETWTGKEGAVVNTAFGGAVSPRGMEGGRAGVGRCGGGKGGGLGGNHGGGAAAYTPSGSCLWLFHAPFPGRDMAAGLVMMIHFF
jgi:hypothetical protein